MESKVLSRRNFIIRGGVVAAGSLVLPNFGFATKQAEKKLNLYNIHTGEWCQEVFFADGKYVKSSLKTINHFMRDRRDQEVHAMDLDLLNLLHTLQKKMGFSKAFDLVCGYRSPKTNAQLHHLKHGVAKNSLHVQGRAVDIRLPKKLKLLRDYARSLQKGGVGYYPRSGFVHVDVREKPTFWGA